ncbi:TPA: hypothetical protein ACKP2J_002947 [Serratia marcescens]
MKNNVAHRCTLSLGLLKHRRQHIDKQRLRYPPGAGNMPAPQRPQAQIARCKNKMHAYYPREKNVHFAKSISAAAPGARCFFNLAQRISEQGKSGLL